MKLYLERLKGGLCTGAWVIAPTLSDGSKDALVKPVLVLMRTLIIESMDIINPLFDALHRNGSLKVLVVEHAHALPAWRRPRTSCTDSVETASSHTVT